MTDREKIEFLRGYLTGVGHTDGTPFSDATLTLGSARAHDIYSMREIEGLLAHLNIVGILGTPSPRAKTQIYKRRGNALYPEIQARRKAVRACGFQNGKAVNLGEFKTQERAAIANRLFNYWKSLGYDDIPTKPQRRQYIWRHK